MSRNTGITRLTPTKRRARYYSLTRVGRRQLEAELSQWERLSRGVNLILQTEG